VKLALWLAAALPLAAQPPKLVNAQLDSRPAPAGLESVVRTLESAQPQPAWIGYTVPAARTRQFGCDCCWHDGGLSISGGTVHLEPPAQVLILMRVDANRVDRIRALAPDCDIDAGGVPFHWLTGVAPSESVALLARIAAARERLGDSAVYAISLHAGAEADAALDGLLRPERPDWLRRKAVSGLRSFDRLTEVARTDRSLDVRRRAMSRLRHSRDPRAFAFFEQLLTKR
jgi:hypothetical protein